MARRIPKHMTTNARSLRNNATEAERTIWRLISSFRPRYTRQLVIGPYIVDLANRSAKLVIEFDGAQHLDNANDLKRTEYLESAGWTIIRFWNKEVAENPEGVVEAILHKTALCLVGTHPQPLPDREGRSGNQLC